MLAVMRKTDALIGVTLLKVLYHNMVIILPPTAKEKRPCLRAASQEFILTVTPVFALLAVLR